MDTRVCNGCQVEQPAANFYRRSGWKLRARCKDCHQRWAREWAKSNPEAARASRRRRRGAKKRQDASSHLASSQRWKENNRQAHLAHRAVHRAIRAGRLVKPTTCAICHTKAEVEGHHEDYAKPLDVVWLCRQCHVNTHTGEISASRQEA